MISPCMRSAMAQLRSLAYTCHLAQNSLPESLHLEAIKMSQKCMFFHAKYCMCTCKMQIKTTYLLITSPLTSTAKDTFRLSCLLAPVESTDDLSSDMQIFNLITFEINCKQEN